MMYAGAQRTHRDRFIQRDVEGRMYSESRRKFQLNDGGIADLLNLLRANEFKVPVFWNPEVDLLMGAKPFG